MEMVNLSWGKKAVLLIGVALGILMASLDSTIVTTAMPKIIASLKGFEYYSWPLISYMLCITIAMPLFGKMADIFGFKPIYIFGVTVFLIGSALCGISHNMLQLAIFRGIQALGGAILISNTLAIVGILFAPSERAKYIGIIGSLAALASIAGPTLGGYLTDSLSWRWVFYVNVPIGIITLAFVFFGFPSQSSTREKKKIDYFGALVLIVALIPLLLAFTWAGSKYKWGSVQINGMLVFSVVFMILFLFVETRAADPIIPLTLFKKSAFNFSVIEMFLVNAVLMGASVYLPLFVQEVLGRSASKSGAIMTPMMIGMVAGTIVSGVLVSKTCRYKLQCVIALIITLVGTILTGFLGVNSNNTQILWYMVVLGIGMGIAIPIFTTAAQNAFSESEMGVATSGVQFFKYLGSTMGSAVLGTVMSASRNNGINGLDFGKLPASISSSMKDPSILQNAGAIAQIEQAIPAQLLPDFKNLMSQIRLLLSNSIHHVFIGCIIVAAVSLIVILLMKEIPLSKTKKTY